MFAFERRRLRRRRHRHFGFEACLAARFLAVFHFQGKGEEDDDSFGGRRDTEEFLGRRHKR